VAEELLRRWDLGAPKKKWQALFADGRAGIGGPRVGVLLPQTYMNDSGRSAGPARGALKVRWSASSWSTTRSTCRSGRSARGSAAGWPGHNGLKSLKANFASPDFQRVRVGVGRPDSTDPEIVAAYVLGAWRQGRDEVADLVGRAADEVERMLRGPEA
jgi:PTH1 family peptidyl-tRNA hydrolase